MKFKKQKIIEILLINGSKTEDFTETFLSKDEAGNIEEVKETNTYKVYEKIYLALQEDEIELANPIFNAIYIDLVAQFHQNESFDKNHYLNNLLPEHAEVVTDILMNDEKYQLHGWLDKKQVFVKEKDDLEILSRLVTETIVTFREYLINKLNHELMLQIQEETPEFTPEEIITMINDYNKLKVNITRRIGRMRSDYN